ncbi:hypothetical protein QMK19_34245 [Streptomyces sp. H10-C2]|uniref:hypothetical protein n=1 Tax=unclassified Streptomyces TaxID=2593676 RepID=UPI0024B9A350|nr:MULTISPECIES: hypothetical protein [unclassified Streptomyces]MDJ0345698.1 hypothetical protein [Streptomyces sp. PH10-H1]MDJ0374550.1 hypothetical protein [Streptomyces sp. H10-C2]
MHAEPAGYCSGRLAGAVEPSRLVNLLIAEASYTLAEGRWIPEPLPTLGDHVGRVVGMRPQEEMPGIAARRVVAAMADDQITGYRAVREDPGES